MAKNSPKSTQRSGGNPGVSIPIQVRVGGAFMALAAVLFLLALVAVFTDGWAAPFAWTPIRVAIVIAALSPCFLSSAAALFHKKSTSCSTRHSWFYTAALRLSAH